MIAERNTFQSADGKSTVAYRIYRPEGRAKGVVQLSHGMCEYIRRYQPFISFLCDNGYAVCGNDHLGHGETAPSEADLGYFAHRDGWSFLAEDVHTLTGLMKKEYPGLPYFLFGHSMGSFIARVYLERYGDELMGAIICGTAGPNPMAGFGKFLSRLIGLFRGERHRSGLIDQMAFGSYTSRFSDVKSPFDWLTRDRDIVATYEDDPLCTFTFTVSAFHDLFELLTQVNRREWAENVPKELPILLVAGDMDPVGDYGKGVVKVYERLKAAGIRDLQCKLYPGDRHEILNELNQKEVYGDLLAFLEGHL